jgi:hypothetical protein
MRGTTGRRIRSSSCGTIHLRHPLGGCRRRLRDPPCSEVDRPSFAWSHVPASDNKAMIVATSVPMYHVPVAEKLLLSDSPPSVMRSEEGSAKDDLLGN